MPNRILAVWTNSHHNGWITTDNRDLVGLHTLRHSYIVMLLANGADIKYILLSSDTAAGR